MANEIRIGTISVRSDKVNIGNIKVKDHDKEKSIGDIFLPLIKGDPGTTDYYDLENKPEVNDVTLIGNKNLEDLNVNRLSNSEIDNIINSIII